MGDDDSFLFPLVWIDVKPRCRHGSVALSDDRKEAAKAKKKAQRKARKKQR